MAPLPLPMSPMAPQGIPVWRGFQPCSCGAAALGGGVWVSDLVRSRRSRRFQSPHPAFFNFYCKQSTCSIRPKGDPCVTLGWPRRDPGVTLGRPNPKPSPRLQQRVATVRSAEGNALPSTKYQEPSTGFPLAAKLSKTVHYSTFRSGANLQIYHLFALLVKIKIRYELVLISP